MPKRISALITVLAMSTTLAFGNAGTAVAQSTDPNAIPIVGTFPGGTFAGTFDIQRFVARNGQVLAVGELTGTLTNTATGVITEVTRTLRIPVTNFNVTQQQGVCEVLELTLGPLDLNLLGLIVHLDQVHLLITADPEGGLLGQLLCSLAGGVGTGNTPAGAIARLLNQILALLG